MFWNRLLIAVCKQHEMSSGGVSHCSHSQLGWLSHEADLRGLLVKSRLFLYQSNATHYPETGFFLSSVVKAISFYPVLGGETTQYNGKTSPGRWQELLQ